MHDAAGYFGVDVRGLTVPDAIAHVEEAERTEAAARAKNAPLRTPAQKPPTKKAAEAAVSLERGRRIGPRLIGRESVLGTGSTS